MGLLNEIRKFVKKFIDSPILAAGVAYLIYKIMSKRVKKESFLENIKIIHKDGSFEVIYDDTIKKYIVVDGRGTHNDTYSAKDLQDAKSIIKKIKTKKNSYKGEKMNKLNTLYEKIVLKEAHNKNDTLSELKTQMIKYENKSASVKIYGFEKEGNRYVYTGRMNDGIPIKVKHDSSRLQLNASYPPMIYSEIIPDDNNLLKVNKGIGSGLEWNDSRKIVHTLFPKSFVVNGITYSLNNWQSYTANSSLQLKVFYKK